MTPTPDARQFLAHRELLLGRADRHRHVMHRAEAVDRGLGVVVFDDVDDVARARRRAATRVRLPAGRSRDNRARRSGSRPTAPRA